MEKFNRAVRRHHVARLKKTRQFYWGYGKPFYQNSKLGVGQTHQRGFTTMDAEQANKVVKNPQMCSCAGGCGNARSLYGMSFAEIRFHAMADEQMQEI